MVLIKYIWTCALLLPLALLGQDADFELETLFKTTKERSVKPNSSISASAKLYSYGQTLSLVIAVKDDRIRANDHVEVWFALPASSYPQNFEYRHHPEYISNKVPVTRDGSASSETPRFFSMYSEYASEVDKKSFTEQFDYPGKTEHKADSLFVPAENLLKEETVAFGIVHFGLFPDGRKAVQYNHPEHEPIEKVLGVKMGDFTEGISYIAERNEANDGYVITARISPEALGFIQLPELTKIRFMVDIADSGEKGSHAPIVLSSSAERIAGKPYTFNQVIFNQPLRTNFTDIPNYLFSQANYNPIFVYGESGWIPTTLDIDALAYKENMSSEALTEVKFMRQAFQYDSTEFLNERIETLKIRYDYVNKIPIHTEWVSINGQLIKADRTRIIHPDSISASLENVSRRLFQFPDKSIGLILRESTPHHPFGWGECGECVVENIRVLRITDQKTNNILNIQQGDGPEAYCQVGPHNFPDSYVSQMDWVKPGKILVIRISHHSKKDQERVKISWEKDGSDVNIEWIRND